MKNIYSRTITQRIGAKTSPITKRNQTLRQGKITFDARQKLGNKRPIDARQTLNKNKTAGKPIGTNDARVKINLNSKSSNKTVDARQRIGIKKSTIGQPMRVNISGAERTVDARKKIEQKRQTQKSQPQIIVTGLANANPNASSTVTRTINNNGGQHSQQETSGKTPIIRINNDLFRPGKQESVETKPIIRIKNDHYKPATVPAAPAPQPVDHSVFSRAVAATMYQDQPATYQQPTHIQPAAFQPPQPSQYIADPGYVQYAAPASHPVQYVGRSAPSVQTAFTNAYINPQFGGTAPTVTTTVKPRKKKIVQLDEAPLKSKASQQMMVESPPQQYRVLITNLHEIVSEDDIVELFGAVGRIKRARMISRGTAEVVYLEHPDAVAACRKYHNRELDGRPMQVRIAGQSSSKLPSVPAPVKERISAPTKAHYDEVEVMDDEDDEDLVEVVPAAVTKATARQSAPQKASSSRDAGSARPARKAAAEKAASAGGARKKAQQRGTPPGGDEAERSVSPDGEFKPLSLGKNAGPTTLKNLDIGLVNKALFKLKGPGSSRPVTFVVKI